MPSSKTPSASTASRPALMTLRNAPLVGRDGEAYRIIRIFGKAEYFCKRGLTGRQITCGLVSGRGIGEKCPAASASLRAQAKQTILSLHGEIDCFVASLLAKMVWTAPDGISVPDWWC